MNWPARGQPVFPNARGDPLSSHGVHYLLAKHVAAASLNCPSLKHGEAIAARAAAYDGNGPAASWRGAGSDALWLRHASIETTQIYLDADLEEIKGACSPRPPPEGKPGRYRPDDTLLAFSGRCRPSPGRLT